MHRYLEQTRYATETLVNAIFHEEDELARLQALRAAKERQLAQLRQGADFLAMNPDLDDEGLGQLKNAEHWDTRNDIQALSSDIAQFAQSITNKADATTALCGALLQIAKRGITGPNSAKTVSRPGQPIDGIPLDELIWEARNQSMHYEAPLRRGARTVFAALAAAHPGKFDVSARRDLAREVIDLLGWKDLDKYRSDMESILP